MYSELLRSSTFYRQIQLTKFFLFANAFNGKNQIGENLCSRPSKIYKVFIVSKLSKHFIFKIS